MNVGNAISLRLNRQPKQPNVSAVNCDRGSIMIPNKSVYKAQKMHSCLILLSGKAAKWELDRDVIKQLLPLTSGETILSRIIKQVHSYKYEPIIVTHREEIFKVTQGMRHYWPLSHRTIADTLLHTQEMWGEQTVVLLGDVIYGSKTITDILSYCGAMQIVGNSAEIFAFTFCKDDHEKLTWALKKVIAETTGAAPWLIYYAYCGLPYGCGKRDTPVFRWPIDRTGDVDNFAEYSGALTCVWP